MSEITLPRFRYIEDFKRFLDKMDAELKDSGEVLKQRQKMLASTFAKVDPTLIKAAMVFNVTPTDRKDQMSLVRKMRSKIDPALTKVVVPNMKKLESQYNMAEDLYDKLRAVEQCETQLNMAFQNRRGDQFEATMAQIKSMKAKISEQLKACFQFLSDIAQKHVPTEFTKYNELIASMVNEHVIFREAQSFLYVSVTPDGDLAFTSYLMLQDVANDEGMVAPHLYISVQWILAKEPRVSVDLNHEYEVPNKLIGSGEIVDSVGEAVKAIADMLELENFSSALGVVPLALQLKVDPTSLNPNLFSYRDLISKVVVDERVISFFLRKEANSPEVLTEVGAQLYKELKALMKQKGVRLTMKTEKVGSANVLTFNIVKVAEGGEFSSLDFEFMRDKFGLSTLQLRKIHNIVNQGK